MFGRGKSQQDSTTVQDTAPADGDASGQDPARGKGRPTPKRRDAELARRNPVVPSSAQAQLAANATKEERKAAKEKDRQVRRQETALRRSALYSGDDKHLGERDRGPARRFVRDYVDARRSVGEYFMFVAFVIIFIALLMPKYAIIANLLLYGVIIVTGLDSYLLRRKVNSLVGAKFPDKGGQSSPGVHGAGTYGMLRALQIRRMRLPKPQVTHGQYPK